MRKDSISVAFFPDNWRGNPYLDLLEAALEELGATVVPVDVPRPYRYWLLEHRGEIDVLHFHWLHYLYSEGSRRRAVGSVLKLGFQLALAKLLGYRIVWTVHNLYPHERRYPRLDWCVRKLMVLLADALLVHCEEAKKVVSKNFWRKRRVLVAPLGNYAGVYSGSVSQIEARRRLDLPEAGVVLLHLGQLRGYKGLEQLVNVFQGLPDKDLFLVLAGIASDGELEESLKRLAERDSRIRLRMGWIPEREIQTYHSAADVVVCPFDRILTSSSVMLAMSMGVPVIAPAIGCLPELVTPESGLLYDPTATSGLAEALQQCQHLDLAQMGKRAQSIAQGYTWRTMAEIVLQAYQPSG